jgi:adenylate cyclase
MTARQRRDVVKDRRLVLLCGAAPVLVAAMLALYRPAMLAHVESTVYDAILRRASPNAQSGQVAIVDIDERSLSAIGQWPWRRDVVDGCCNVCWITGHRRSQSI